MTNPDVLNEIKRLKAIADIGLLYAKNDYDKERYTELQEIAYSLLSSVSETSKDNWKLLLPAATAYPTAKVDIRGLILSHDQKVLLIKESADGRWALPGGWADVGYSPKETVVKECREETGLDVTVKALLAVFDKRLHAHPPQPFYVYKMVFYCEAAFAEPIKGFDVLDVQYFPIDQLPKLSEDRILKSQIELVYRKVLASEFQAYIE